MEPKLPTPLSSPELGGYRQPEVKGIEPNSVEKKQEIAETPEVRQDSPSSAPPVMPVPLIPPTPSVTLQTNDAPASSPIADDNPLYAKDEELIEKEWVDKAKKIVQETKSNPYQQEDKVSRLQADYIKKRYGKDIKVANN